LSELSPSEALRAAIVGAGLVDDRPQHAKEIKPDAWPRFLAEVRRQRLTGLALHAVEEGLVALTAEQADQLITAQRELMLHALQLERHLLMASRSLEAAGVEAVVLKGTALAQGVYPNPSLRPFGDIDLLVRNSQWGDALETLALAGFRRRYREPRPGFTSRFGHAALLTNDQNVEIDLHRTLVAGPFGEWISADELFDRTARFPLGGVDLRRLDDTAALAHACVHASLGFRPPLLVPVRDVAQLCASPHVEWDLMRDWSSRWHLGAVFEHAFETVTEILGSPFHDLSFGAALATNRDRRGTRALRAYTSERRRYGGKATATILAIHGIRAKLKYVGALLFPDRAFLASRANEGSAGSYVRRWLIPFRWLNKRLATAFDAHGRQPKDSIETGDRR
jgi:hypothetical protein